MYAALEKVGEVAAKAVEKVAKAVTENAEQASSSAIEGVVVTSKIEDVSLDEKTTVLKPNIEVIKGKSLESLIQCNLENLKESAETTEFKKTSLTEEEKALIKKETGWSDEIINSIENMDQYEIYKNADLHEAEVNGRKCLLKDINLDYVDPKTGKTNRELMSKGKSPIDSKTGEKIELHHMGQDFDNPFAELDENSEHGDGKDAILHDKTAESWRQDTEKNKQYNNVQRPNHWKARAMEDN